MQLTVLVFVMYLGFSNLWLDSSSQHEGWYFGTKTDIIDKELLGILPPAELSGGHSSYSMLFLFPQEVPEPSPSLGFCHLLLQETVKQRDADIAEPTLKIFVSGFEG